LKTVTGFLTRVDVDTTSQRAKKAVFLDRDGVINVEKGYVHRIEEFELLPGVPRAIRLLKDAGFLVIVVTNQSGIARGYYPLDAVHRLHRHLDEELAAFGACIDAYYVCPHHPEHGIGDLKVDCSCRKPLPGMLEQAAADFGIHLSESYMIGDKPTDVEAGLAAGCRPLFLGTVCGAREGGIPEGIPVFPGLLDAVRAIVEPEKPQ
jgi:D-glycero-D-manno-heptose 1,7-bisphosphate phosphatase